MAGHVTTRLDEIADAIRAGDSIGAVVMLESLGDWALEVEDSLYVWKRKVFELSTQLARATNEASQNIRLLRSLRL